MIIFTPKVLPHLVVMFFASILFVIACFMGFDKLMPFSKSFQFTQDGETATSLALMLLLAVLGGIHYGVTFVTYGVYVYMAVLFIVDIVLWKKAFNISWEKVKG